MPQPFLVVIVTGAEMILTDFERRQREFKAENRKFVIWLLAAIVGLISVGIAIGASLTMMLL